MLADRLDSEVQLDSLQLRVLPRLRAEGTGLTIRHKGRTDVPPLISVRSFSVEGGVMPLLRKHVSLVTLEGLEIKIPPRDKGEGDQESDPKDEGDKNTNLRPTLRDRRSGDDWCDADLHPAQREQETEECGRFTISA